MPLFLTSSSGFRPVERGIYRTPFCLGTTKAPCMKVSNDFRWRTASDLPPQLSILLGGRHRPLGVNILSLLPCGFVCIWCQICITMKVETSILILRVLTFSRIITPVNIRIVNVTEKGLFMVAYLQYCFINPFFPLLQLSEGWPISSQEKQTNHMKFDIQFTISHVVSFLHVNVLLTSSVKVCLFSNADPLLIH